MSNNTQEKFHYTRDLEKQVIALQEALQRCQSKINILEKDLKVVTDERDAWKERACNLQSN